MGGPDGRQLKKLRRRQRELIHDTLDAILDGEDRDEDAPEWITEEDLARAEREGLIDPAHLDLFVTWYFFGGPQRGLSPQEIADMPAAMRRDFVFLLGKLGQKRRRRKRAKGGKK